MLHQPYVCLQETQLAHDILRYVAKRYNQSSVLGSYLDPLADKVLIGCVVGALGYQVLPTPPAKPVSFTGVVTWPSYCKMLLGTTTHNCLSVVCACANRPVLWTASS